MEEAIRFFRAFEIWIYLILGLGGVFFLRRFIQAWKELQSAIFGLERENAQSRLNTSASALVLLLSLALAEFVLVTFVAPTYMASASLPTPTLSLLATATLTVIPPAGAPNAALLAGTPLPPVAGGCLPGQIEITTPQAGTEVSGVVAIQGTVNIPNFGFYKFEIKRPDETLWLTIQAGNTPVMGGKLGDWDTTRLAPGEYDLALIAVDNQGQALPACVVRLRVARPTDTPIGP